MIRNDKVFCDYCRTAIQQQKHVRLPRTGNKAGQTDAHFHNRADIPRDCWQKVQHEARERRASAQLNLGEGMVV